MARQDVVPSRPDSVLVSHRVGPGGASRPLVWRRPPNLHPRLGGPSFRTSKPSPPSATARPLDSRSPRVPGASGEIRREQAIQGQLGDAVWRHVQPARTLNTDYERLVQSTLPWGRDHGIDTTSFEQSERSAPCLKNGPRGGIHATAPKEIDSASSWTCTAKIGRKPTPRWGT